MVKVLTLQMRSCRFEPPLPHPIYLLVLGGWLNVLSRWDAELKYSVPEDWWLMIAYIVLFSVLLSRLPVLACGSTWVTSFFIARFLLKKKRRHVLAWLVPHETAAVSAQVLCTPYNHAPCHFMQSHICKVYACLAVTCHLHFWQNDWDISCATVVTWGWKRDQNKSQHRKLTLEKKILLPLLQGFEPTTFQSWVRRSNHCTIPTPDWSC